MNKSTKDMSKELAYINMEEFETFEFPEKGFYGCRTQYGVVSKETASANCKLFSQAPAMYEKWLEFLELMDNDAGADDFDHLYHEVKDIIKKIES